MSLTAVEPSAAAAERLTFRVTAQKSYQQRVVLDATFAITSGEFIAIVGENGAGKSTLARIAAGLTKPESGTWQLNTTTLTRFSPQDARAHGVGMVQQHGVFAPTLTLIENAALLLGHTRGFWLRRKRVQAVLAPHARRLDMPIPWDVPLYQLTLGQRQRGEILVALAAGSRVLILDEPTALLSHKETENLYRVLRDLADRGTAVAVITHQLNDIAETADRIVVLRHGRVAANIVNPRHDTTQQGAVVAAISRRMVGANADEWEPGLSGSAMPRSAASAERATPLRSQPRVPRATHAAPRLAVDAPSTVQYDDPIALPAGIAGEAVTQPAEPTIVRAPAASDQTGRAAALRMENVTLLPHHDPIHEVSLRIAAGEIVGIAGIDGNGQTGLVDAIAGVAQHGQVWLADCDASRWPTARRRRKGLGIIAPDRHDGGVWLQRSIAENLTLTRPTLTGGWRLRRRAMQRFALAQIAAFDIRPADPDIMVAALSGGNQQKVLVARELASPGLRVLVAANPTRGVDFAAAAVIHRALCAAQERGVGVLLISSDLDELLALSQRVFVLVGGRIAGEVAATAPEARAQIGAWMTGAAHSPTGADGA